MVYFLFRVFELFIAQMLLQTKQQAILHISGARTTQPLLTVKIQLSQIDMDIHLIQYLFYSDKLNWFENQPKNLHSIYI